MKPATIFAVIAVTFPGAIWLHAEDRMRAGLWEVISNLNGKQIGSLGSTCYTPAMVAFGNQPASALREATEKTTTKRGCTLKEFKIEGNTMSMTTVCGSKVSVITSTYTGDTFETVDKATTNGATEVIRMTGRRIGECK
jgi:hypothetical protein